VFHLKHFLNEVNQVKPITSSANQDTTWSRSDTAQYFLANHQLRSQPETGLKHQRTTFGAICVAFLALREQFVKTRKHFINQTEP
jgi:hypothetical protein